MTRGTVLWDAIPGDPELGHLIAAELDTYVRLMAVARRELAIADAEAAMTALLASLED